MWFETNLKSIMNTARVWMVTYAAMQDSVVRENSRMTLEHHQVYFGAI
jgi:hypothetical protein